MSIDDGVLTFQICIRDLKATNLTTRHRFKEKLKLILEFDDKPFKTKKELVGGGDVAWQYAVRFEWQLRQPHSGDKDIWELAKRELEKKQFRATATCQHDRRKNPLGSVSLDLFTACTGPVDHNLPLKNAEGTVVGRLNFSLEMTQLSNVAVMFKYIKLRNLKSVESQVQGVNPYLKFGYSKQWAAIQQRKVRAIYSVVQHQNSNPEWKDLPWLRFKTSLNELIRESIVVHITHKGRNHNIPIGRVNLLFRTLVDNGKSFKEEDTISFKGPLKIDNSEIEGTLNFKFLPRFAQMVPITVLRKPVHTEKGIYDATPILPWVPKPNIPILRSAEVETSLDTNSPMLKSKGPRARSNSLDKTRNTDKDKDEEEKKNRDKNRRKSMRERSSTSTSAAANDNGDAKAKLRSKKDEEEDTTNTSSESESESDSDSDSEEEAPKKNNNNNNAKANPKKFDKNKFNTLSKSTAICEDLIDFSSPSLRRDRAMTMTSVEAASLARSFSTLGASPLQATFVSPQAFAGNVMSLSIAPSNSGPSGTPLALGASSLNNSGSPPASDSSYSSLGSTQFPQPAPFDPFVASANPFAFPGQPQQPPVSNPFVVV